MSENRGQSAIDSVLKESRVFPPPADFTRRAHVPGRAAYDALSKWFGGGGPNVSENCRLLADEV